MLTEQVSATLRKAGAKGGHHVLDADIRDYFGSIDHDKLMKLVARRISDQRMLKVVRQWLEAGLMEDGTVSPTVAGTPQGGVISPLLSNIYLHVLDVLWTRHSAPMGTLVRYADDFVVMCRTRKECERAEQRIRVILERLGLELHPAKTRRVVLYDVKEGFDFLGCHLHERLSGKLLEQKGERLYFLQRWPSQRSMQRIRQRVKELTPRSRCHADPRDVIADLNPLLRGWGEYFRTGNAATRFNQLDTYVWRRLRNVACASKRLSPPAGRGEALEPRILPQSRIASPARNRPLPGATLLEGVRVMLRHERPPVSRVREICMHGLKGGSCPFTGGHPTMKGQDLPMATRRTLRAGSCLTVLAWAVACGGRSTNARDDRASGGAGALGNGGRGGVSNPGAAGSSGDGLDSTIIPITSDVVNVIDADTCWEWDGGSACTYPTPLPDTPVIVPENVSLIYTDGAGQSYLIASSYPSPCGDGWQWGDNVVVLCPTACDFVTSDPAGSMRIVASCNMPHPIR